MSITTRARVLLSVFAVLSVAFISVPSIASADSINIASVTLNGTTYTGSGSPAAITVAPGATINASASVVLNSSGNGGSNDWQSTGWRISATSGTYTCVNTADHNDGNATFSEAFDITAPATPGTYNVYFATYGYSFSANNTCATSISGQNETFQQNSVVTVVVTDTTAPTVTINQAVGQVDPTSASPINFTVVFSESVADFATGDVTLSGTAGATTATVTGSGTTYNVAVSGMTTSGTVIASIAAGAANDAAGNDNTASTATDNSVTYNAVVVPQDQTITVTTHAPASAVNGTTFPVAATASSLLSVAITTTGGCTILDGTVTMTSDTTACVVHYNQAGNASFNAAPEVTETTTATTAAPVCPVYVPVAGNVITNPSFEEGYVQGSVASNVTAHNWRTDSFGTSDAVFSIVPGHTGCNAAQITVSTFSGSQDNKWIFTDAAGTNNVAVTPGQYYTVSFWYKSSVQTEADIFFTGSTAFQWLANLAPAADWTKFETSFLVPNGVTNLTIGHTLVGAGTIASDDYSLVLGTAPVFSNGLVSLTFDDGWKSIYTNAIPALNAKGLKSTQYITTDPVILNHTNYNNQNGTNDFMVLADLVDMSNGGHEIAAHSRLHCDLVALSAGPSAECPTSSLLNETTGARNDLKAASSTWGVTNMAYPYGQYNDTVIAAAQAAGYLGARSVDQGYNFTNTDKFKLKIQHVRNTTTVADVQAWVDYALQNKLWLVLMFHRVENDIANCVQDADGDPLTPDVADADCTTTAVVEGIANYLATKPVGTTVTMNQVLSGNIPVLDTTAPAIAITSPITGSTITVGTTTISGTTDDNTASVKVGINNKVYVVTPAAGVWSVSIPDADALPNGTYSIVASSTDAANNTGNATAVSLTVAIPAAPNVTPVAEAQSVALDKNGTLVITLTGTDTEGGSLTFSTTTNPTNGVLTGTLPVLTYTPTTDFTGSDSFTFVVFDGNSTSTEATITITVNAPAPAPAPAPSGGGGGGGGGGFSYYGNVSVNNGDATTTSQTVTLSLNSNANQVWISNDASFLTGSFTTLSTTMPWTLPAGEGSKTVYVRFGVGSSTYANAQDSIYLAAGAVLGTSTPSTPSTPASGSTDATCYNFTKNLGVGSSGADVTALQNRITAEGVYTGPVTGVFGPLTFAGVKSYQAKVGLPSVGVVGPLTRAELNKCGSTSTNSGAVLGASTGFQFNTNLGIGSTGTDVTELQNRLTSEGVYTGPVTGVFGPLTFAGVKSYQAKVGLPSVGVVGPLTRAELNK